MTDRFVGIAESGLDCVALSPNGFQQPPDVTVAGSPAIAYYRSTIDLSVEKYHMLAFRVRRFRITARGVIVNEPTTSGAPVYVTDYSGLASIVDVLGGVVSGEIVESPSTERQNFVNNTRLDAYRGYGAYYFAYANGPTLWGEVSPHMALWESTVETQRVLPPAPAVVTFASGHSAFQFGEGPLEHVSPGIVRAFCLISLFSTTSVRVAVGAQPPVLPPGFDPIDVRVGDAHVFGNTLGIWTRAMTGYTARGVDLEITIEPYEWYSCGGVFDTSTGLLIPP